ncbi:hypothetical protein B0H14DRAFT_2415016, partial [Mycena olivaceomarginata]
DPKNLNSREREDYTKLKANIYNAINIVILQSLNRRSHYGDTLRFGDGIYRTGFPGILIESIDFQELAAWLGMRSSQANFPCPKCLVPMDFLAKLTQRFEHRNTASMRNIIEDARGQQTKRDKEEILRGAGLHDVEQILWEFGRSDPYKAVSYDTLHWDDGGKFGRHLWVCTKQVLKDLGKTNEFNKWYGACRVRLFIDSSFILTPFSRQGLDKNFNFLKQHYTCHAGSDIREKGATKNMSTRPGEGFQQEVTRHYNRTNGRDAERQMVVIDENEEAMARLDMIVADAEACENQKSEDTDDDADDTVEPAGSLTVHWRLSAPDNRMTSRRFETEMSRTAGGEAFNGFDIALRQFLSHHYPEQVITFEEIIMVQSFRAVHIDFQSMVDWAPQRDIMRCSPQFYGRPRYDCVLYNAESDPLSLARLVGLLRCTIPGNSTFDLAFVYRFKNSKWKPRTIWKGCRVVEECGRPEFLPLEHVARGALLARAWGSERTNLYFPIDTIDDDMFLRLNNIE